MVIKGYRIAKARTCEELEEEVERMIKDNWQPFGSMVIRPGMTGTTALMQPMVWRMPE